MASNASVEKLKALGIRHGEKAVVALASALCLFFLFKAATNPTIDVTPEQVDSHAKAAQSNINRKQDPEKILEALAAGGIKNPEFEKKVDEQAKNLLVASHYSPSHAWAYPQPGAGLIRDTPELIAPTELVAFAGRGGAQVYELNADGQRVIDEAARDAAKGEQPTQNNYRGRAKAREERRKAEEKKEFERKERELKGSLAGAAGKAAKKDEAPAPETVGPWKETTRGVRWVAVTGVLDYKKLRENYFNALKRPEVAYPHFKRLELERQALETDGSWSSWAPIDADRNNQVLYNLPEVDTELVPEAMRFEALVDPLPFLNTGLWRGVHVARLVPEEKRTLALQPGMGMPGMMPGMEMAAMDRESMMAGMRPEMSGGMEMGMPMPGGGDVMNFPKSEEETLMVRGLDFTVEPDRTYRFRARIVVYNPNRDREDVSPGVDTKSLELAGPWSDPTDEVTMPADVTAYAMRRSPDRRVEKVQFQVTRWDPTDGVTVYKNFDAAPGEVVGDVASTAIPVIDGSDKKSQSRKIDYTSHQVVLDVTGGDQPLPPVGAQGNRFEVPATTLLVRPDGSVVLRDQAVDAPDPTRKDIEENYAREKEESNRRRAGGNQPPMP
jgi:hypothetical protein